MWTSIRTGESVADMTLTSVYMVFVVFLINRKEEALQPGCDDIICSHKRAYQYYAESVYPTNDYAFLGIQCSSLADLDAGRCMGKRYPMGYATPPTQTGEYYLRTNDRTPYGKKSRNPSEIVCNVETGYK